MDKLVATKLTKLLPQKHQTPERESRMQTPTFIQKEFVLKRPATIEMNVVSEEDIDAFLVSIFQVYGYDFRAYSKAHIRRRIMHRLGLSQVKTFSVFKQIVLSNPEFADLLLRDLSINVTEMFRDPLFYRSVRELVVPVLKTWSYIKVWHAGCSTGEEVYSMAILLKEEGLYDRCQIYATDFNQYALKQAKEGIYRADAIKKYALNYQASGAKASFSDYYHAQYDSAIMDASLKKNIVWAHHNLVTDSDFAETQIIVCRNVMIYFNRSLQNQVHKLFYNSLSNGGVLCLGNKENLQFTDFAESYEELDKKQRIYKKRYAK